MCYDCSQSEEVALDSFAERNCLEYFFLGQEDDVMLEWFEKAGAEFEALCDSFENVIGRAPTEEAKKHMRDAAVAIVTIARQWVLTKLRKSTRISKSKFIIIRQDVSSMWAIRIKKHFMYNHVSTERKKLSFPTSPTARDFQIFASVLLMKYEGPSMETAGSSASTFQFSDREIPHFPSNSPVFQRETFWRWQSTDACSDLIIASVEQLFASLLFAASEHQWGALKLSSRSFSRRWSNYFAIVAGSK